MKLCPICDAKIIGRADKTFCSLKCKSAYQYAQRKHNDDLFFKIDKQLKTNRKLLKTYNKAGLATIRKELLLKEGFNPKYFTHYWKTKKGDLYLFCYEYGFLEHHNNGKKKYTLITWQSYMERNT